MKYFALWLLCFIYDFGIIFIVFERNLLCSQRPHFVQNYSKKSNIVKYYYNLKKLYFNIF